MMNLRFRRDLIPGHTSCGTRSFRAMFYFLVVVAVIAISSCSRPREPVVINGLDDLTSQAKPFGDKVEKNVVTVSLYGAVERPGTYTVLGGSTLTGALSKAGGPSPGADLTGVPLFRKVDQGEIIYIPSR